MQNNEMLHAIFKKKTVSEPLCTSCSAAGAGTGLVKNLDFLPKNMSL